MEKTWNNCVLLNSSLVKKYNIELLYKNYITQYNPKYNIWYDLNQKTIFGLDSTFFSNYYFTNSFESCANKHYNKKIKKFNLDLNLYKNEENYYYTNIDIEQFKNKSVTIIGGGPSTDQKKWYNIKTDQYWSCNHFYLNPLLKNKKIDLIFLGHEVDLTTNNKLLHNYLIQNNSICLFEDIRENEINFSNIRKNPIIYMYNKYRSKLGTLPRMICLAIILGFKDIYFIGMDGLSPNNKASHSFEKNKPPKGKFGYNLFRQQYVCFWDYILNYWKPNVNFYNLGESVLENLSTSISKTEFPLNYYIQKSIK